MAGLNYHKMYDNVLLLTSAQYRWRCFLWQAITRSISHSINGRRTTRYSAPISTRTTPRSTAPLKDLAAAQAEKADQSALDALAAEVAKKAATAALDALSKKLASMPCLVTGTYTGDGAESRLISLGFQPKALLVMREEGYSARPYTDDYYGGLALPGKPVCLQTSYGTNYILTIESKGFRVYYNRDRYILSNQKDTNYYYLAWK